MEGESRLEVPPHVLEYLGAQKTLTLATASPTGVPRATTLTFVNDGPTLYVWTRPEGTVARHVEQNPLVSFAIDEYAEDWRRTRGVQGNGEALVLLAPDEIARIVGLFEQKFTGLSHGSTANLSFFAIAPTALEFIDGAAATGEGEADQELGLEFRREVVYDVFRDLPPQAVATIATTLQTITVEAGTVIVRQGGPADKFFIVVDGEVEATREDHGETRSFGTLGRGQFFGELAILRDSPRTATVTATVPTTLLTMERDVFRDLVAQSLGMTRDFDRLIKDRLYALVAGA